MLRAAGALPACALPPAACSAGARTCGRRRRSQDHQQGSGEWDQACHDQWLTGSRGRLAFRRLGDTVRRSAGEDGLHSHCLSLSETVRAVDWRSRGSPNKQSLFPGAVRVISICTAASRLKLRRHQQQEHRTISHVPGTRQQEEGGVAAGGALLRCARWCCRPPRGLAWSPAHRCRRRRSPGAAWSPGDVPAGSPAGGA